MVSIFTIEVATLHYLGVVDDVDAVAQLLW